MRPAATCIWPAVWQNQKYPVNPLPTIPPASAACSVTLMYTQLPCQLKSETFSSKKSRLNQ